jgi:Phage integrase, N-terminal SAM-like domain
MPADSKDSRELIAIRPAEGFQVPALVADVGPKATKRFFEFFTVPIRNKNTRTAYYHAIRQFLDWCERCGFRHLEDIEPITVAPHIEQHAGSPATIKQHMAAIRMMFSWLTEKGILAMNPAREVKTPKFSRNEGKTPAPPTEDVQKLIIRSILAMSSGCATKRFSAFWLTPLPESVRSFPCGSKTISRWENVPSFDSARKVVRKRKSQFTIGWTRSSTAT